MKSDRNVELAPRRDGRGSVSPSSLSSSSTRAPALLRLDVLERLGKARVVDAVGELPDEQKGVADVLVGRAAVQRDLAVDDAGDRVDEAHDLLLEHLGGVGELPDVAKPKNAGDAPAGDHWVELPSRSHVARDDLGARVAEPHGQQGADLVDGVLQNPRLHQLLALGDPARLEPRALGRERVLRHGADFRQHPLHGPQDEPGGVALHQGDPERQRRDDEGRADEVERGGDLRVPADVEHSHGGGA